MIEVLLSNGDTAEADTPDEAVFAARTMIDDAEAAGAGPRTLTASFYAHGRLVRYGVGRVELASAA